jgi:putative hemolysin
VSLLESVLETGLSASLVGLALILASAFFSSAETALFSLQPRDRKALAERGEARTVDALLAEPRRTLASVLIGNKLVNVLLATLTAGLLSRHLPGHPWLTIALVTPIVLVLGEILPKSFALRFNRPLAPLLAPPLRAFSLLVSPLRWLLLQIAHLSLLATGGSGARRQAAMREAQLLSLLEEGRQAGAVGPMEEQMIQKVFEFGDLQVSRLMTPRPDVFSLNLNTPWPELLDQLREAGHSRVPIWQNRPDNVIGILVVKDLLPQFASQFREAEAGPRDPRDLPLAARQIQKLLRPAHFVPTSKRAEEMLAEFRAERFHLAMVVDEHGNVVGLVTLDDLLAELVGELLDEGDELPVDVTRLVEGVYTIRGNMDVDDFELRFGRALPEGEYDTVAGFLLDQVGRVPAKGEEVQWEDLRFVVRGMEGRRITEVCLRLPGSPPRDDEAQADPATARSTAR